MVGRELAHARETIKGTRARKFTYSPVKLIDSRLNSDVRKMMRMGTLTEEARGARITYMQCMIAHAEYHGAAIAMRFWPVSDGLDFAGGKLTGHAPPQAHQHVKDVMELLEATENFEVDVLKTWDHKDTIATLDMRILQHTLRL